MKQLRVAVAQIWQEQNSFSPLATRLSDFERTGLCYGQRVIEEYGATGEIAGFLRAAKREGNVKILPVMRAWAWPGGILEKGAYRELKSRLRDGLRNAAPFDGVLLSLHGAMTADGTEDVEGDLLETIVRDGLGDVPPAVTLDMHANLTGRMVRNASYIEAYHTCPHVDLARTGEKAARTLFSMLRTGRRAVPGWVKLPMITPANLHDTRNGPLKTLMDHLKECERARGTLGISLFPVQPWLDVPELGWSVIAYTDSDPDAACGYAEALAARAWSLRRRFSPRLSSGERIVRETEAMAGGTMVVSDSDSTTSGATGDNTCMLRALLRRRIAFRALCTVVDAQVVRAASRAGAGSRMTCRLGGKADTRFCRPVDITATVQGFSDGRFTVHGHLGELLVDVGKCAVLRSGTIDILVTERIGPVYEQNVFRQAGLKPRDYRLVVVKSPVGFRKAYEKMAARIRIADCPGAASANLLGYSYRRITRPLFPLDDIPGWKRRKNEGGRSS